MVGNDAKFVVDDPVTIIVWPVTKPVAPGYEMLPPVIPAIAGIEIAVRYIPGVNGVDIGGDWYDVIPLDEHRFFFVVGDVSGRGVDAGAVMASLHFAMRGFVSEGR